MAQVQTLRRSAPPVARSPEREALAAAIARCAKVQRELDTLSAIERDSWRAISQAREAVTTATAAIEEAKVAGVRHLTAVAMGNAGEPPLSVKDAKRAAEDAQENLDALIATRDDMQRQIKAMELPLALASLRLAECVSEVLAPVAGHLVEEFAATQRRLQELRAALHGIETVKFPDHLARWESLPEENYAVQRQWRDAIEALATDADAPLPA